MKIDYVISTALVGQNALFREAETIPGKPMKLLKFLVVIAGGILTQLPCLAGQPDFCITSPDRPAVWYNRTGDKLSQYLEWNQAKDQLVAHVAYANVGNTPAVWRDQSYIDTFKLAFPTVHLDSSRNRLYVADRGHRNNIGHLEPGVFGIRVVLNSNLELFAHRRDGVVNASILSTDK